ncbi:hypothetical protein TraAM80_09122 [Trypanosoma rangeli]|uniref:Uncharacterized protein n=1 Tax=Trypanosoma rangeli TaxID=5698 RepID=A0A3R7N7D6_TRYRA|nr:uncharacterized protein TraAM80_09122 [Trypanosoma rangeli]RNE97829.1 hypothetical protein TraAM80_09122 [Trypanosoma rangeli]|eukprot:RNE97829.1 hypothetical protein TraAM80_09122 [Trypanosoma rangeli]
MWMNGACIRLANTLEKFSDRDDMSPSLKWSVSHHFPSTAPLLSLIHPTFLYGCSLPVWITSMKEMLHNRRCRRLGKWGPSMWYRDQQQHRQQQLLSAQVSQVRFQQYHQAGGAVFLAMQRMNPHTVKSASCIVWGRPTPLRVRFAFFFAFSVWVGCLCLYVVRAVSLIFFLFACFGFSQFSNCSQ